MHHLVFPGCVAQGCPIEFFAVELPQRHETIHIGDEAFVVMAPSLSIPPTTNFRTYSSSFSGLATSYVLPCLKLLAKSLEEMTQRGFSALSSTKRRILYTEITSQNAFGGACFFDITFTASLISLRFQMGQGINCGFPIHFAKCV